MYLFHSSLLSVRELWTRILMEVGSKGLYLLFIKNICKIKTEFPDLDLVQAHYTSRVTHPEIIHLQYHLKVSRLLNYSMNQVSNRLGKVQVVLRHLNPSLISLLIMKAMQLSLFCL